MEVLNLFQLEDKLNSHIRELSGGMKRRLLIARGLINMPKILILDEPTIGLDPQAKFLVWRKLAELKSQRVTQLLCTQNMEEATALCDRVAIMNQGRILSLDTPSKLVSRYVGSEIGEIEVDYDDRGKIVGELKSRGLDFEEVGSVIYVFHIEADDIGGGVLNLTGGLKRRPATLEDVFFKITGRSLTE